MTATSSGSFHHWYLTSERKKSFISQSGLFYCLLLELLHVQLFFWFSVQPQGQEVFFVLLSSFLNSSGFSPQSPHPETELCTCGQSCHVPDIILQSCGQSASSHGHVGCATSPEWISGAAHPLSVTRDCLLKNAGPHAAEAQTMNGLQIISLRSYSDHIFLSPRDRGVKALEMQGSAEA